MKEKIVHKPARKPQRHRPWSSLVEGDEQLDQPNSQTTLELCHECVALFFWVEHKHNSFLLGRIQPSSPSTKELHAQANQTCLLRFSQSNMFRNNFTVPQLGAVIHYTSNTKQ